MSFWDILIQGIIQGATEFLPVSSSGHLSIAQHILGGGENNSVTLSLMLHLGTLAAVFVAYWNTIKGLVIEFFDMVKDIFKGKFSFKGMTYERKMIFLILLSILPMFLLMIPIGNDMKIKDIISGISEDKDIITEGVCFLITGALLLFVTYLTKKNLTENRRELTYRDALIIGTAQTFAALPGVSRSGSTTTVGMICGLEKNTALAFSFIMGIPAILGSSVLEIGDAIGEPVVFSWWAAIVGVIVAGIVGIASIKLLKWIVSNDKLDYFGYYCLVLGVIVIAAGIYEKVSGNIISL